MEDEYEIYRLIFSDILGPIVALLGILGNVFCLLAIWHRNRNCTKAQPGMKGYMYTLLCGLALADLGYLAFTFTFYIYFSSTMELQCDHMYYRDRIIIPICNSFKASSDFIVICMTVNRCQVMGNITGMRIQALRKDAITSNENTSWNTYFQITTALIIGFVLHLPFYFFDSLDSVLCNNGLNETSPNPEIHFVEEMWWMYYFVYATLVKVVPVVLIITLNIVLVKRLKVMASRKRTVQDEKSMNQDVHQNRRAWSVHNKTSIKEQKLASLLVIIAVSYFIFTLPANVTFVLVNLPINVKSIQDIYYPLTFVTNFFESLNYAANFYIYCAVHSEIRESFLELCKAFGSFLTCADKKYGLRF